MSTNKEAYDVIRNGVLAAMTGFQNAKTLSASEYFMNLYRELDDELDALIASRLEKDGSQYAHLTQQIDKAKERMQAVRDEADKFVRSANIAAKIVSVFTKVLTII